MIRLKYRLEDWGSHEINQSVFETRQELRDKDICTARDLPQGAFWVKHEVDTSSHLVLRIIPMNADNDFCLVFFGHDMDGVSDFVRRSRDWFIEHNFVFSEDRTIWTRFGPEAPAWNRVSELVQEKAEAI